MPDKREDLNTIDERYKLSIERLQKIVDETQQTTRAYDVKAEVLAIMLTLVIAIINFTLVKNYESICAVKFTALGTTIIGVISLFLNGLVLYPKKDIFQGIQTNSYKPKRTYFVNTKGTPAFNNVDVYVNEVDSTDWKHELAYEVLKTSLIRDRKHRWYVWALSASGFTLAGVIALLIEVLSHV